jgi:hypothetical protein
MVENYLSDVNITLSYQSGYSSLKHIFTLSLELFAIQSQVMKILCLLAGYLPKGSVAALVVCFAFAAFQFLAVKTQ